MSRTADVTVHCPLCGEPVECWIDAGEPAHGPTYSCGGYPGSPPGLDDFEPSCECVNARCVKPGVYYEMIEGLARDRTYDAADCYDGPDRLEEA